MPIADLIVPTLAVPASVTPRCRGISVRRATRRYASIISRTSVDFTEMTMSRNPNDSQMPTCRMALSYSASAVGYPCLLRISSSREPEFTPMRMGIPRSFAAESTW